MLNRVSTEPYILQLVSLTVFWFLHIDHEVVDLHAYDPQGTIVEYSLDTDGPFDIDPDLGRIFVNDTLDREVSL